MYVVGATQGRMFEDIRKIVPNHFLLVPGIGARVVHWKKSANTV